MPPSAKPDPEPRWQRRPAERRREILDAAILSFGENGYQRATLTEVAERAGVCQGTVSYYFGSKGELFEAVIADRFAGVIEREEAGGVPGENSSSERLERRLRRLWDHIWTPGTLGLIQVMHVDVGEFPESGQLLCRELSGRWRRLIANLLDTGIRSGEFRRLDVDVAARIISYAMTGVAQRVAATAPFDPRMPAREVMWTEVWDMISQYVQPMASPATRIRSRAGTGRRPLANRTEAE
ncbi:MAG: TetR/AcrR family transcriptional regulator [Gemmatimonadota bacterium]